MHRLVEAVGRRSAGIAAGVILTGGLAGGVLLTPGTAYAATPTVASTSTMVTASVSQGVIHVQVTVSNTSSGLNGTPTGSVSVTTTGGGCNAFLFGGMGHCDINGLSPGPYTLTAVYAGVTGVFAPSNGTTWVKVAGPPANTLTWVADSPSLNAQAGQNYSYTFRAVGSPWIRYSLNGGFSGMSINPYTGTVSGTVPNYGNSFSYSVTATNGYGQTITTSWYTVYIRHFFNRARLSTSLSCTSPVFTGTKGRCTLWVTNSGYGNAPAVNAQIALPRQLKADYCGYYYFNFGCSISGNTASQNLGTLSPGQTKSLTVTFTARTGFWLWGWHHGYRFTVKVVGSASSSGYPFFQNGTSYSTAYVTIVPRGWWA